MKSINFKDRLSWGFVGPLSFESMFRQNLLIVKLNSFFSNIKVPHSYSKNIIDECCDDLMQNKEIKPIIESFYPTHSYQKLIYEKYLMQLSFDYDVGHRFTILDISKLLDSARQK